MARQTVAVIGAGVSGMTAAYILQRSFEVTVFEANSRLGGNADTRTVGASIPVDLGFVAFSDLVYPSLTRLFGELGVNSHPAVQSTDVICNDCNFIHMDSDTLGAEGVPHRPDDATEATWNKFVEDRVRFGIQLGELFGKEDYELTVGDVLQEQSYSDYFIRHYLYPRITPWFLLHARDIDRMPIQFLSNTMSPLAGPDARASWRVVEEGSRTYIERIAARLPSVRTSTPVRSISRNEQGVDVRDGADRVHHFDKAVIAVHPPQALRILSNPTPVERIVLSSFEYSKVEVVLHTDNSVLPSEKCTSGLMMHVSCATPRALFADCHVDVTKTQHLPTDIRYLKSLNPTDMVDPSKVVAREFYQTPVFTRESIAAQRKLPSMSDYLVAWAGAYHGNGFHEAGCKSGVLAAETLGAAWD
jgi:uncharacterized protein